MNAQAELRHTFSDAQLGVYGPEQLATLERVLSQSANQSAIRLVATKICDKIHYAYQIGDETRFLRDFYDALAGRLTTHTTKHCHACAAVLDMRAELCPSCGVRQPLLQRHVRAIGTRLVPCPECGSEVSPRATKCLRCGVTIRRARRGPIGLVIKWTFILWNILMIVWLISGLASASQLAVHNAAEETGRAIGTAIGVWMIMVVWMVGSIILGILVLLSRPRD
jgi:hypothetical protein